LQEETGLAAGSLVHAGHLFLACGFSTQGYDVFLATQLTHVGAQREPSEHGMVTRVFELAAVEQMIREGIIRDANTVAALGLLKLKGLLAGLLQGSHA